MFSLADKVIIITGATSGLGEATAILAAQLGATVVLAGRRQERGQDLVARIQKDGGRALFVTTDVTREADIEALVARTVAEFGRVDGAFNNAGLLGSLAQLDSLATADYDSLVATNLRSVFLSMKHELRAMKERNIAGSIVNCSSMAGVNGFATMSAYTATKHAICGLTKAAALENGALGIRVNAVLPGAVRTEIWNDVPNAEMILEWAKSQVALKRLGTSKEIAWPVVFLLSDAASYITGASLVADGGFTVG